MVLRRGRAAGFVQFEGCGADDLKPPDACDTPAAGTPENKMMPLAGMV
jgi:hypothetical protein